MGNITNYRLSKAAFDREYLANALQQCDWSMTRVSAFTGLERTHLYRKLKAVGLSAKRPLPTTYRSNDET
jgi:DNA-binding NtrC family response regulator